MLDLSIIILTFNEEIHIRRCISNCLKLTKNIFVIDSFSTDKTVTISRELGAIVLQHKWENNHAKQLNWGLDNAPIKTNWVLRLDADEYIEDDLINEIKLKLPYESDDTNGIFLKRKVFFLGRWMKNGTYPVILLRLFKYGKAQCEQRLMDEHIYITEGTTKTYENNFVDYNLNDIGWWLQKHIGYSIKEAAELLNIEYHFTNRSDTKLNGQAKNKRSLKYKYQRQPLFLRAFAYFFYRYVLKGGFMEGIEGFLWNFFQGLWYRILVDLHIWKIKKICNSDKLEIQNYLQSKYKISFE